MQGSGSTDCHNDDPTVLIIIYYIIMYNEREFDRTPVHFEVKGEFKEEKISLTISFAFLTLELHKLLVYACSVPYVF